MWSKQAVEIGGTSSRSGATCCTKAGRELFGNALPQVEARARSILDDPTDEERDALICGLTALQAAISRVEGSL